MSYDTPAYGGGQPPAPWSEHHVGHAMPPHHGDAMPPPGQPGGGGTYGPGSYPPGDAYAGYPLAQGPPSGYGPPAGYPPGPANGYGQPSPQHWRPAAAVAPGTSSTPYYPPPPTSHQWGGGAYPPPADARGGPYAHPTGPGGISGGYAPHYHHHHHHHHHYQHYQPPYPAAAAAAAYRARGGPYGGGYNAPGPSYNGYPPPSAYAGYPPSGAYPGPPGAPQYGGHHHHQQQAAWHHHAHHQPAPTWSHAAASQRPLPQTSAAVGWPAAPAPSAPRQAHTGAYPLRGGSSGPLVLETTAQPVAISAAAGGHDAQGDGAAGAAAGREAVQYALYNPDEADPTNVYVAALPEDCSTADLEELFSKFGKVLSCKVYPPRMALMGFMATTSTTAAAPTAPMSGAASTHSSEGAVGGITTPPIADREPNHPSNISDGTVNQLGGGGNGTAAAQTLLTSEPDDVVLPPTSFDGALPGTTTPGGHPPPSSLHVSQPSSPSAATNSSTASTTGAPSNVSTIHSRNFGFVLFERPEDAEAAVRALNGYVLGNVALCVRISRRTPSFSVIATARLGLHGVVPPASYGAAGSAAVSSAVGPPSVHSGGPTPAVGGEPIPTALGAGGGGGAGQQHVTLPPQRAIRYAGGLVVPIRTIVPAAH